MPKSQTHGNAKPIRYEKKGRERERNIELSSRLVKPQKLLNNCLRSGVRRRTPATISDDMKNGIKRKYKELCNCAAAESTFISHWLCVATYLKFTPKLFVGKGNFIYCFFSGNIVCVCVYCSMVTRAIGKISFFAFQCCLFFSYSSTLQYSQRSPHHRITVVFPLLRFHCFADNIFQ